jgi:hypothetical protein
VEAQRLIPELDLLLRHAISAKAEYQEAVQAIQETSQRITMMGGTAINRDHAIDARDRRDDDANSLRTAIEKVQEVGCLVKDLDVGLVDFPTLYRGQEVCLCWKLGEKTIDFWHGMDEGVRGRKAIDQDFLDHHQGDRAQ